MNFDDTTQEAEFRATARKWIDADPTPFWIAVPGLLAYLRSWSATQRYIKALGEDPVTLIEPDLRAAWGDPAGKRDVRWQFHLRVGRV